MKHDRKPKNLAKLDSLVIAVATGRTICSWAAENGVSDKTAYMWSREPSFREAVANHRRELIDQCLGQLTDKTGEAVGTLGDLMQDRYSRIRLDAAIAVLDQVKHIAAFSHLESRIDALEKQANGVRQSSITPDPCFQAGGA